MKSEAIVNDIVEISGTKSQSDIIENLKGGAHLNDGVASLGYCYYVRSQLPNPKTSDVRALINAGILEKGKYNGGIYLTSLGKSVTIVF